jgi:tetratricopeptide (TPR) repeat protein
MRSRANAMALDSLSLFTPLFTLVISLVLAGSAHCRAIDQPANESANTGLEVGDRVALKDLSTALLDGDRSVPNRGESVFRVERIGGEHADIATDDGTVRGWVRTDQIVPVESASAFYSRKIEADPKDAQAHAARGQIWVQQKKWDRALADLDEAIKLSPQDPRLYYHRGKAYARNKQHEKALADLNAAIRLDPGCAQYYHERGLVWDKKRYFDKAIDDLSTAIRLDPANVSWVMARGKVCSAHGRHNQALDDFEWVIRTRPGDPLGYAARGEEWLENLESDKAIGDFTRAIEVDPSFITGLLLRAKAWKRRFDFKMAIADYAEAIRLAPENPLPRQNLAWLLATCPEKAFRDGQRAVQEGTMACELTHYNDPECLNSLAAACADVGDFKSAVKWQARAVDLLPKDDKTRALFRRRMFIYEAKHPYRD